MKGRKSGATVVLAGLMIVLAELLTTLPTAAAAAEPPATAGCDVVIKSVSRKKYGRPCSTTAGAAQYIDGGGSGSSNFVAAAAASGRSGRSRTQWFRDLLCKGNIPRHGSDNSIGAGCWPSPRGSSTLSAGASALLSTARRLLTQKGPPPRPPRLPPHRGGGITLRDLPAADAGSTGTTGNNETIQPQDIAEAATSLLKDLGVAAVSVSVDGGGGGGGGDAALSDAAAAGVSAGPPPTAADSSSSDGGGTAASTGIKLGDLVLNAASSGSVGR